MVIIEVRSLRAVALQRRRPNKGRRDVTHRLFHHHGRRVRVVIVTATAIERARARRHALIRKDDGLVLKGLRVEVVDITVIVVRTTPKVQDSEEYSSKSNNTSRYTTNDSASTYRR